MKKLILLPLVFLFGLGFSQITKVDDNMVEALMKRDLTLQEQKTLNNYMNKKFIDANVLMADTEKIIKAGLYIPTEYEAECAGGLISRAKKDGHSLKKYTYEQLWDAAGDYCREYVEPYRNNNQLKKYYNTKFTNLVDFEADSNILITQHVLNITEKELQCAIRFIKSAYNEGYDPTKNTYEEILENGKAICNE